MPNGDVRWIEICFCDTPLAEERPYWEAYFELTNIRDAHARSRCRDANGSQPWSCIGCDCTARLERVIAVRGRPFVSPTLARLARRWFRQWRW